MHRKKIILEKHVKRGIVAFSGGSDSLYLVHNIQKDSVLLLLAHFNHQARGIESEEDRRFVEYFSQKLGLPLEVGTALKRRKRAGALSRNTMGRGPGFEEKAREERYRFLRETKEKHGADKILVAHTADDQVETVLMRILEGAGISGLKGIPRSTKDGIERPLLELWRKDILLYLKKHKIPYRIDRSNFDTRFERNWIRHVLIPLLEKRYGKSLKRRIFTLGERFREIDAYIEDNAQNWLKSNNIKSSARQEKGKVPDQDARFQRKAYSGLPTILRIRILQILCFERIGTSPNERLLGSMDRLIVSGRPSGRMNIGKGATLRCRYGEAILAPTGKKTTLNEGKGSAGRTGKGGGQKIRSKYGGERGGKSGKQTGEYTEGKKNEMEPFLRLEGPGLYEWKKPGRGVRESEVRSPVSISWTERRKIAPGRIRKLTEGERQAVFDAERLPLPLSIRPLRIGDKLRPFGFGADKKVKEILIDRKVPREERWGRPVVCDAEGKIIWIPGVVRSAEAPVTGKTRRTIMLRAVVGREPHA